MAEQHLRIAGILILLLLCLTDVSRELYDRINIGFVIANPHLDIQREWIDWGLLFAYPKPNRKKIGVAYRCDPDSKPLFSYGASGVVIDIPCGLEP